MISERMLQQHDWHDFYCDAVKEIPGDMVSKSLGNLISTHCLVDASSHGSKQVTQRSQMGILIFCNKRAPILW